MPAPRLLDKKLIHANLATERKQEIDKGIKIAKSVDALREERTIAERDLEEFRTTTLKTIQIQIGAKQSEYEHVDALNKAAKEERIRLEGPIDLVEAWNEVHELKDKNESISDNLLKREISVTTRENDVHDAQAALFEREQETARKEVVVEENLGNSEEMRQEAANANIEAQEILTSSKKAKADFLALSQEKATQLDAREAALVVREEALAQAELDINNEKILLADRRTTLDRGFEELRRTHNGTSR